MNPKITILLGAGASKDAGMPIVRDLSDPDYLRMTDNALSAIGINMIRHLLPTCEKIRDSDSNFESILAQSYNNNDRNTYNELLFYYHSVLLAAETYGGMVKNVISDTQVHYYMKLAAMLGNPKPIDWTVISFNHDLLIEYSLYWRHFGYGSIEQEMIFESASGWKPDGAPFQLLKMHGSFNFMVCTKCAKIRADMEHTWNNGYPSICPNCGGQLEPHYVPPLQTKSTNRFEATWKDAALALENTDLLLIFGYSMPSYDEASRTLLHTHLNNNATVCLVDKFADRVEANYRFLGRNFFVYVPMSTEDAINRWWDDPAYMMRVFTGWDAFDHMMRESTNND